MKHYGKRFLLCLISLVLMIGVPAQYSIPAHAADSFSTDPMIDIGQNFYVALASDGTVWGWGENGSGQLATGNTTASSNPVQAETTQKFKSISAGASHVLALAPDGTVWAWGENGAGQLGIGSSADQMQPTQIPTLSDIISVATADHASFALTSNGNVYAWGSNTSGKLGLGLSAIETRDVPTLISTLSGVCKIFAGESTVAAIASDGKVWLWGENTNAQAGNSSLTDLNVPTCKSPTSSYQTKVVALGTSHTSFLQSTDTIVSFGLNSKGQFGNGTTDSNVNLSFSPATTSAFIPVDIAAGSNHMIALSKDGKIYTWGDNSQYQLGAKTVENTKIPTELVLSAEDTVTCIAAAYNNTAVIDSEGHVYTWGSSKTPAVVPNSDGTGSLYLGLASDDIVQDVYVTASATIPAPSFQISIPAKIDFGTLEQKSSTAEGKIKSVAFSVSASQISYLFGKELVVQIAPETGSEFVLTGTDGTLPYTVYNKVTGGEALSPNDRFAVFTDDGTVAGRIEIDQSRITTNDTYTGKLIFHVSTAETQAD